jgi:hypothetical protein
MGCVRAVLWTASVSDALCARCLALAALPVLVEISFLLPLLAGGRWQLDVLVSVLFTALAAFLFVAGLPVFASPAAAAPWAAHILCAAMPALLALPRRSWCAPRPPAGSAVVLRPAPACGLLLA